MVERTSVTESGATVHRLEDTWTLWLENKEATKQYHHQLTEQEWVDSLQKIGDFNTIEGFYAFYIKLRRPSELARHMSYYLFRGSVKPTWENFPEGGHWTVTLTKTFDPKQLDRLWEQMAFALIGEQFNSPHMVGAVLSARKDCNTLSVWSDQEKLKFSVGENLRLVLNLEMNVTIEYKSNKESIKDATGRGGESYVIKTPKREAQSEVMPPEMDLLNDTDVPEEDRKA